MADTYKSQYSGQQIDSAVTKTNGIADYVIEKRTANNWTYHKYASGTVTMWGRFTVSATESNVFGAMYYSESVYIQTPFGVYDAVVSGTAGSRCFLINAGTTYADSSVWFRIMSAGEIPSQVPVQVYVVGRWK